MEKVIIVLHGRGSQNWMTNDFETDRRKALHDRTKFTDAELEDLEIEEGQGGGRTNEDTYIIKTFPFPIDTSRSYVDIRDRPKVCGR